MLRTLLYLVAGGVAVMLGVRALPLVHLDTEPVRMAVRLACGSVAALAALMDARACLARSICPAESVPLVRPILLLALFVAACGEVSRRAFAMNDDPALAAVLGLMMALAAASLIRWAVASEVRRAVIRRSSRTRVLIR